jgi:hypothetical protein
VRRNLARVLWTRTILQAFGVALAVWLILSVVVPPGVIRPRVLILLALVAAAGVAMALARQRGAISVLRAALWIEEHETSGYALVTWVEQASQAGPSSGSLGQVVERHSKAALSRANALLPTLARDQLIGPLLFCLAALSIVGWSVRYTGSVDGAAGLVRETDSRLAEHRAMPIGAWNVRVIPPAYTNRSATGFGDARTVRALTGSRIEITGTDALPDSVRVMVPGAPTAVAPRASLASAARGWQSILISGAGPLEVRVNRDRFAKLLLVEGVGDSVPRVVLTAPARDSVLRRAEGIIPLEARLHDDIGLMRASFDVVISSGEGERFTMRGLQVGARVLRGTTDETIHASLDLRALALSPGDVVHVRAIARDAHPAADHEAGTSETRSFRVARASEYDSIAVEPAPPPEVDKSLLSQRMLLMLTERLEQKRPRLTTTVLRDEAGRLARDQSRLRQAVGDAVFQRLTGEAGGEHSHFAGDGHEHGVEAVGGKLALSGVNAQGMLEEGDDSPVIAINKPLLEAYNAMWDAGRALEQADPRGAIPFMRIALEAIERARAASRLYLRGRPPSVIIDLAKVRLTGKDQGAPAARDARAALPAQYAQREARLLAAATLAAVDASAARDSLAILRLESLADAPAFATALSSVLDALARGPSPDVTEPFLRARRVLGGIARVPDANWSRSGPP